MPSWMSDAEAAPAASPVASPATGSDEGAASVADAAPKLTLRQRADAASAAAKAKADAPPTDSAPIAPAVVDQAEANKLARAQAALERTRAQAAAHRKATAEAAQLRQQLATAKASEAKLQELAKLVDQDPYAAMHAMGITPEGLGKHGTPEAALAKMKAEFDARVAQAEEKAAKLEQQIQAEKTQAAIEEGKKQILSLVESGPYPHLQGFSDRMVIKEVNDLLVDAYERTKAQTGEGIWFPFADALSHLESEAAQKAAARTQKTPTTTTAARAGADGKQPQRPALNNQAASRSAGAGTPATETQEQRKERIVKMMRDRRMAREG